MLSLIKKILSLFGGGSAPAKPAARKSPSVPTAAARASAPAPQQGQPEPEGRGGQDQPAVIDGEFKDLPGRKRAAALDGSACQRASLQEEEKALLEEIDRRIGEGKLELPQLPSTSVAIMNLTNDPRAEIADISRMISGDPVLSGQLVRTANSALYGGQEPVRSIHDGVMRIGMRAVRTLILSASVKGTILTGRGVASYGKSVWRQALSVARIAWSIGPKVGMDKDNAFLLGLLHDIGKLPLLAMLDEESRRGRMVSRALIGKVFHRFHERVGSELAKSWQLGDELASVTGCHHKFDENEDFPKSAALVSLAHKLDLYQSLRDEDGFYALMESPEMEILEVPAVGRRDILDLAMHAYGRSDATPEQSKEAA
ncbi:MAG: HDOD domain-containing protein [Planctomycetota bacterium]